MAGHLSGGRRLADRSGRRGTRPSSRVPQPRQRYVRRSHGGLRHRPSQLRDGDLLGRLRQRRIPRSVRDGDGRQRAVQERRGQEVRRRDEDRGCRRGELLLELRLRRHRSGWRRRSVRRQLRGRAARQQHLLRRRTEADAHLLSSTQLQAAGEHALPQQRRQHLHRCERVDRHRQPSRERLGRGDGRLRRRRLAGRVRGKRHDAELLVPQRRQGTLL